MSDGDMTDRTAGRSLSLAFAAATLAAAVAVVRWRYCSELPGSADLVRQVIYGRLVWNEGLAFAGLSLRELTGGMEAYLFAGVPYNYPPVALLFFTLVAAVSPTLFAAKVALTILEAANAILVWRVGRSGGLALLYWASPVSIWWVSHEGQFEPVQSFWVLVSLWCLRGGRTGMAFLALSIAVQAKLSAILLLPWLVLRSSSFGPRTLRTALAAFLLGLAPTAIAQIHYPALANVAEHSSFLDVNPYYWNPWSTGIYFPDPELWVRASRQFFSYGFLVLLVLGARASKAGAALLAPAGLLLVLKLYENVMPWYVVLIPSFLVPLLMLGGAAAPLRRRFVVVLVLVSFLMEPTSARSILDPPEGRPRYPQEIGFPALEPKSRLELRSPAPAGRSPTELQSSRMRTRTEPSASDAGR